MKTEADLKECSRCCVYTPQGDRLPEARVVLSKQGITIYFPSYSLEDKRLRTRVDFYDERLGLVMTLSEILIRRNPAFPKMEEPWMGEVKILETKRIVQRQKDVRVKVNMEVLFDKAADQGSFYGTIRNISAGGFYLTARELLERGEHIFFSYRFRTLTRRFEAEVLRREGRKDEGYGYGCCFVGLTDGADAAIRSYVYKKQQEKRMEKE